MEVGWASKNNFADPAIRASCCFCLEGGDSQGSKWTSDFPNSTLTTSRNQEAPHCCNWSSKIIPMPTRFELAKKKKKKNRCSIIYLSTPIKPVTGHWNLATEKPSTSLSVYTSKILQKQKKSFQSVQYITCAFQISFGCI